MSPKVTNLFWATFVNKFVAKNFKQSPNLVTLIKSNFTRFSRRRKTIQNCAKKFGQKEMCLIDPFYFFALMPNCQLGFVIVCIAWWSTYVTTGQLMEIKIVNWPCSLF